MVSNIMNLPFFEAEVLMEPYRFDHSICRSETEQPLILLLGFSSQKAP